VSYVRDHYDPRAIETPWQRRFVSRFPARQNVPVEDVVGARRPLD